MKQTSNPSVLAIGIDAAEPSHVKKLIDSGQLPTLGRLLAEGRWLRVESPANIGSGSVWPTFMTGAPPEQHGVYSTWTWQADTMQLRRFNGDSVRPFWKKLDDEGVSVGALDVPFAPLAEMQKGFQINEWGPHEVFLGREAASPPEVASLLKSFPRHPFYSRLIAVGGPADIEALDALTATSLESVKLRGDLSRRLILDRRPQLALIVFPEIHHSAHYLWHTVEPDDELYEEFDPACTEQVKGSLFQIYAEIDRQVERLLEVAGEDTNVIVFALHGMRSGTGVAEFLPGLLCEKGFARLAHWKERSLRGWLVSALAEIKRLTPRSLKRIYYSYTPQRITKVVAQPTLLPLYDWSQTRVFSIPSDQHGWVRINLQGREKEGIVSPNDYDQTCIEIENMLRDLRREDGRPLVHEVLRTAADYHEAQSLNLPDLIVHWENAALSAHAKIKDSKVEIETDGNKYTGQHAPEGFCLFKGRYAAPLGEHLTANELQLLITQGLKRQV